MFDILRGKKIYQMIFFVVTMVVMTAVYVVIGKKLERTYTIEPDDFWWVHQVDSLNFDDGKIVLEGWVIAKKRDSVAGAYDIIFEEVGTEQKIYPKMEYVAREDVNDYFLCEYDFVNSGYVAKANIETLELDKRAYEILIWLQAENVAMRTGTYVYKDSLYYVNPLQYREPEVQDELLIKVMDEGDMRVYMPELGVYVYQYNEELYWLFEDSYGITEETIVQYQLITTQNNRLPKEQIEEQRDYRSFKFGHNEIQVIDENIRVAKAQLPSEYSIVQIWTGEYQEDWIWRADFRPHYNFNND